MIVQQLLQIGMEKGPLVENSCLFWPVLKWRTIEIPAIGKESALSIDAGHLLVFLFESEQLRQNQKAAYRDESRESMIRMATIRIWPDVLVTYDMMMQCNVCKHPHTDTRAWTHSITSCTTTHGFVWQWFLKSPKSGHFYSIFYQWIHVCRSLEPRTCSWKSCSSRRKSSRPGFWEMGPGGIAVCGCEMHHQEDG